MGVIGPCRPRIQNSPFGDWLARPQRMNRRILTRSRLATIRAAGAAVSPLPGLDQITTTEPWNSGPVRFEGVPSSGRGWTLSRSWRPEMPTKSAAKTSGLMLMPGAAPDRTRGRHYVTRVAAYGLVMLTVVLAAAAIYTFSLIIQRQTALRVVSRYNATWLVSQAATEVSRLTAALVAFGDTGTASDVDEVQLRHDIVINRLKILTDGDQGSFSPGRADLRETLSEFDAAITFSTPIIEALRPGSSTTNVYSAFLPLLARLNRLTASMHERGAELITADLQNLENLASIIAGLLISLILCCFGIILLTRWNYGTRQNRDRRVSELQAELVHLSRLTELGQMVSALAHEVNQPLTAMTNYLGVLRRLIVAGDQQGVQQAIRRITEQVDRARQIIQRLRDQVTKREAVRACPRPLKRRAAWHCSAWAKVSNWKYGWTTTPRRRSSTRFRFNRSCST
jgi:hypothetical protein